MTGMVMATPVETAQHITPPQLAADLTAINRALAHCSPDDIVRWALGLGQPALVSTSMGPAAAATLHAVAQVDASVPVVWVDTGFNLPDTCEVAEEIRERLGLNLHVYRPLMSPEQISRQFGGVPTLADGDRHKWFTRAVKLEPFQRALADFQPSVWFTGIRAEETLHRRNLDIVSRDHRGILKVAPFFTWTESDIAAYIDRHDLPSCRYYFDPTKAEAGRECGLHTVL